MPSGITSRHSTNPRSNPFTHAVDVDPNILAVVPHDPYGLLPPGVKIIAGDIKRLVGEGQQWVPVEEHEYDHLVPSRGCAYARVEAPENYLIAAQDDSVSRDSLVWTSNTGDWTPASQYPEILGRPIGPLMVEFRKTHNQLLFVAVVNPVAPPHKILDVPARHRVLYPGERLRRGDRMIFSALSGWEPTKLDSWGQPVSMPDASNGEARFCRPIDNHFQHWYVDPKGQAGNMGGAADPWPSVEYAEKRIEEASKAAGAAPHGIIWEGQLPKMVYDLPEQEERATISMVDKMMSDIVAVEDERAIAAITKGAMTAKTGEQLDSEAAQPVKPKPAARRAPAKQSQPQRPLTSVAGIAQRLDCTTDELRDDATRQLPRNFRLMIPREEIGRGDLMYQLDEELETAQWKPAPDELFASLVGAGDMLPLFARRTLSKDAAKELVNRAREQHSALGDTLSQLSEYLHQR